MLTHSPQEAGLQHLPSLEKPMESLSTFGSLKDTILYQTILEHIILYQTMLYYAILYHFIVLVCYTMLYRAPSWS